jgi:amino acid permease
MIQRIQTLFLFLVFLLSLATYFFPIASFWGDLYVVKLGVLGVEEQFPYGQTWPDTIFLSAILGLIGLLAFVTIFLYKRRIMQIRLIRFDLLLTIVYLALIFFYYVPEIEALTMTTADYINEPGIYLSIAIVLFLVLANRFVRKDEKLVRAADRLR